MAWTSLTFAFGSLLTSTKMTQLQTNFSALAAGDVGAPSVVYAAMSFSNNIVAGDIATGAIDSDEIATSAVIAGKIATGAVSSDKIAVNAVTAAKIADGAVITAKLDTGAVTSIKIAADTVSQGNIANSAIGQGELKSATSSSSVNLTTLTAGSLALVNTYSWWSASSTSTVGMSFGNGDTAAGTIGLYNHDSTTRTFYLDERYIQASPPYLIGDQTWGHFFFVLRKIGTKEIIGTCETQDPHWAYRGEWLGDKNHIDRMTKFPHPFADYWERHPSEDGLEVVLIDLRGFDIDDLKLKCRMNNTKADQELIKVIKPDLEIKPEKLGLSKINNFSNKVKIVTRV